MKALLLCNYERFGAATINEHINAIIDYSRFNIFVYEDLVKNNGELNLSVDLDSFEVIIVHYSIFLAINAYCSTNTRAALKKAKGVKIAFLQDEYRFVDRSINAIHEAGINIVFTCVPEHSLESVYPRERMGDIHLVHNLTGYVSEFLAQLSPKELRKRRYDVSYRGRLYPDWHGSMGREKFEIAEKFLKRARWTRLKTNISCRESKRLYGLNWVNLIRNSRAVLGIESGASVFDFSGSISNRTETVRNLLGKKGITYETLREKYFAEYENTIDLSQISSRVFEAMSLRTLCILYEGRYSDVIKADAHYLSLKKDFSNFDYVVSRLKDRVYIAEIIANAYADVVMNDKYSYANFIKKMDNEIIYVMQKKFPELLKREQIQIQKQDNFECERKFQNAFQEKHPFIKIQNPHYSNSMVTHNILAKLSQVIKPFLSFKVSSTLKNIIR